MRQSNRDCFVVPPRKDGACHSERSATESKNLFLYYVAISPAEIGKKVKEVLG